LSYKIHVFVGERFSELANRIDFRKLAVGGLVFMISLIALSSGLLGLLIAAVSTAVSLVPAMTGVSRTHSMGCLLLPTLLFFMGFK
jgi:TctA family transporter